jgi:WD40 repeat protein
VEELEPMTPTVASTTLNPFVGPKALTEEDQLFGRTVELKRLHSLLNAERIVLLYSPSGAGKTSLLHAGLKGLLVQDGFVVRPTIRVTHEMPPSLGAQSLRNRYALSTLLSLEAGRPSEFEPAALATMRLDEYLATTRTASTAGGAECLLFDQFEELFTVDPIDVDEKRAFLEEVGQALRDPDRWAVFSMREEFVAHLDPYLKLFPTKLRTRFRLDLLRPEPAIQAIQGPAREAGVEFSDEAASLVVDDLRTVLVQRGSAAVPEEGPTVEPVQLQVVCHRLWTRLGDVTRVEPEHVRELGDVDNALRDFYDDIVREVAHRTDVSERAIRTWISDQLVTEQGYRAQTQHGPAEDANGRVLPALEDAHLVRADRRRTTDWYELAHDRLVDPVKSSNVAWLEEHLSVLQRGARLWDAQRRDGRALLVGPQLREADEWAAQHPGEFGELERDFLKASTREEARVVREERSTRRTRLLAITASIVSLAAIAGLIAAIWQWQKVNEEKTRAERVEQAMAYFIGAEGADFFDPRARLLLDEMALEVMPRDRPPPPFILQAINSHLHAAKSLEDQESGEASSGAVSPTMSGDGRFVASQSEEGVRVTDLAASEGTQPTVLLPLEVSTDLPPSLAMSHDGALLAVSPAWGAPGQVWNVRQQAQVAELDAASDAEFEQFAFSKSSDIIVGKTFEGRLMLWDANSGRVLKPQPFDALEITAFFDLSSTGLLAASAADGSVHVVDLTTKTELLTLKGDGGVFFDEGGQRLAVWQFDRVDVFAIPTGESLGSIPMSEDGTSEPLGFLDGDTLLMFDYGGDSEPLCGLQEMTFGGVPGDRVDIECPEGFITLSDDGERILVGGEVEWSVWSTDRGTKIKTNARPEGTISSGGAVVALVDGDGRIVVRTVAGEDVYTSPPGREYQRVVVDGDGNTIVASSGRDLFVIDLSTQDVRYTTALPKPPARIATSDDAGLVAASADGQVWRWFVEGREGAVEELAHSGQVTSLAVTGSGGVVAAATSDAMTIYTRAGGRTLENTKVVGLASDPTGDALAAVIVQPTSQPDAERDERHQLLLWDDVAMEPRPVNLPSGRPTALALSGTHVVIAGSSGVSVYDRPQLQPAGGFRVSEEFVDPRMSSVAVAISGSGQPAVTTITAAGTPDFTFNLDREGIRKDLEEAVSKNGWEGLTDEECREITGIDCS